ncbi:MAG: hypothetical protein ACKVQB_07075, partial [Bacteroidia bacterium]
NTDKKIQGFFVQQKKSLKGKLGLPAKKPTNYALLSWPLDSQPVSKIRFVPAVVIENLNKIVKKPVSHLYAEVLDTISTYQEIIQYDLNDEFQLTQKIIDHYKTYPGLRLEFMKKVAEKANINRPNNLGLDIFKLTFYENASNYIVASENNLPLLSQQSLPDYYIYANLDNLKTDPFWEPLIKTNFKTMQLHAESLGKGSIFILNLERN